MYRIPSAEENIIMEMPQKKTNLHIFCGTWPKWYFHYNIFFGPCFRVYFLRTLVIRYFLWHYLYSFTTVIELTGSIRSIIQYPQFVAVDNYTYTGYKIYFASVRSAQLRIKTKGHRPSAYLRQGGKILRVLLHSFYRSARVNSGFTLCITP